MTTPIEYLSQSKKIIQELNENQAKCKDLMKKEGWAKFDEIDILVENHKRLAAECDALLAKAGMQGNTAPSPTTPALN